MRAIHGGIWSSVPHGRWNFGFISRCRCTLCVNFARCLSQSRSCGLYSVRVFLACPPGEPAVRDPASFECRVRMATCRCPMLLGFAVLLIYRIPGQSLYLVVEM
ncbi:hypothetical protein B0H12DRAFT_1099652, partial [Mycena haematopus]